MLDVKIYTSGESAPQVTYTKFLGFYTIKFSVLSGEVIFFLDTPQNVVTFKNNILWALKDAK